MKKISIFLSLVFFLSACGKEDGGVSPDETFIPNVSGGFSSTRSPATTFFIVPEATNVNTSPFTGTEQPAGSNFSGSFTNYDISFTFLDGAEKGVKYTGRFVKNSNPLRMDVKGTNGVSLTLTRIPNP